MVLDTDAPTTGYAVLAVLIGGAVGAVLRCVISAVAAVEGSIIPVPTLLVNTAGSFLIGLLTALLALSSQHSYNFYRSLLLTGVLGGLTTFSTLCLESALMSVSTKERRPKAVARAVLNVALHNVLCIGMVFLGLAVPSGFATTVPATYV